VNVWADFLGFSTLKIFNVEAGQMAPVWPCLGAVETQICVESAFASFATSCRFDIIPAELARKPA
jgi:hypothetical protein